MYRIDKRGRKCVPRTQIAGAHQTDNKKALQSRSPNGNSRSSFIRFLKFLSVDTRHVSISGRIACQRQIRSRIGKKNCNIDQPPEKN